MKTERCGSSDTELLQNGGHLFAECGGMMYLGEYITDTDGHSYPMCGFLPQGATMENMKLKLGYRKIFLNGRNTGATNSITPA